MPSKKSKKLTHPKKNLLEIEPVVGIESKLELDTLMMKKQRWICKLFVNTILPRSYYRYKIHLSLDEKPYLDRIKDLEEQHEKSLLAKIPKENKKLNRTISEIETEMEKMRMECEEIEFSAQVEALKYKNNQTLLQITVPDDVIEPFNRQKFHMNAYKVTLTPTYEDPNRVAPVLKEPAIIEEDFID